MTGRLYMAGLLLFYPLIIYISWKISLPFIAGFGLVSLVFWHVHDVRDEMRQRRTIMASDPSLDEATRQQWERRILHTVLANLVVVLLVSFIAIVAMGQLNAAILRWYPAAASVGLLVIVALSLVYPPSVAQRIARLAESDLSQKDFPYTQRVTQAWCVLLLFNIGVSVYTAVESTWEMWLLYNGLISYVLVAVFFVGERFVRHWVKRKALSDDQVM